MPPAVEDPAPEDRAPASSASPRRTRRDGTASAPTRARPSGKRPRQGQEPAPGQRKEHLPDGRRAPAEQATGRGTGTTRRSSTPPATRKTGTATARTPRPARPAPPATEAVPRGERRRQGRPAAVAVEEEPSAAVEAAQAGEDTAEALWCPTCETHVPIADLDDDDACPTCGQRLGARRVPLKFKLMIAASVIYLGYRAYQGITWVAHHV
ncbi:hypothetical protein ACFFRE_01390 [Aciditerrimonas ferrireducens]|uniref:Zinc ribbon domain-containing protein n=1 Tax=Aciditerrimonas ferrireducens TaxID=667306 RepID=A0ABV6BZF6_9ACTN